MNGPETFTFPGSSNLASATYDPDTENLDVAFQSGDVYTYFNVPMQVYRTLTLQGGSFFYRSVRSRYAYEKQ